MAKGKFETESIKSSLCDYSDPYILVTGDITVSANNDTHVAFKSCAPLSTCKTEINNVLLMKQIIFTLQYLYTIWLNTVIIIQIHQEVYGSLKEMNLQLIMLTWMLIISINLIINYLNIKHRLYERKKLLLIIQIAL